MVISVFIDCTNGKCIETKIDEVSELVVSDIVILKDIAYRVISQERHEHYNYSSVVVINEVTKLDDTNDETSSSLFL